jgi:uncharacterized protein (TIGR02646 family)
MKWKKINKQHDRRPSDGTYKDWKPLLAEEGEYRCVYCALRDNRLGGLRVFHVEHFKPKSKFAELTNVYDNLFYSCPICNSFKKDSWFNVESGNWDIKHYPYPVEYDYSDCFKVDSASFNITGTHNVGKFLVERLHLNRPHLLRERRREYLLDRFEEWKAATRKLGEVFKALGDVNSLAELVNIQAEFHDLFLEERGILLYADDELR